MILRYMSDLLVRPSGLMPPHWASASLLPSASALMRLGSSPRIDRRRDPDACETGPSHARPMNRFRVVTCGGGIAAVEGLLRLRKVAQPDEERAKARPRNTCGPAGQRRTPGRPARHAAFLRE